MAVQTFTRTLFHDDLTKAQVKVLFFENNKYTDEKPVGEFTYKNGITKWQIVQGGKEAKALEQVCDKDEYDEYLILYFENGDNEIYPNNKVAMFIL